MGEKNVTSWPSGDWFVDQESPGDLIAVKREEVILRGRTAFQEYEIFVSTLWGKALILDGRLQSAELDEFVYHEALVHPAMLAHPEPRRVLVMGGGEGATLREVLRHNTVTEAVMVDIDQELVDLCRQYLPSFHAGSFDDPRTTLIFADGRAWLADQPDASFDIVLWDLPEPQEGGPAALLFTREMFEVVRRKLTPRGIMAIQSGSANVYGRLMSDLNATLRAVFPRVFAYTAFVSSYMDLYGFHAAGGESFIWPTAAEIRERLKSRGIEGLRWYAPEFAAALPFLPRYLEDRLAHQGRILTEAEPYQSYVRGRRTF